MSVGEETELLSKQQHSHTKHIHPIESSSSLGSDRATTPKPQTPQLTPSGLLSKFKKTKSKYTRLPTSKKMTEPAPKMVHAQSAQLPQIKHHSNSIALPATTDLDDQIMRDSESPAINLHSIYSSKSKDDLDLPSTLNLSHQPRASAVNPISIPLHASQKPITLDTRFLSKQLSNKNKNSNRANRSFSEHANKPKNTATPSNNNNSGKTAEKIEKTAESDDNSDNQIEKELTEEKGAENEEEKPTETHTEIERSKRPSVMDVFNVNMKTNSDKGKRIKITKLKKEKSVFDAFKIKEKKVNLSNISMLPNALKNHLNDDASDHAIQHILDHIRGLDEGKKDFIYAELFKDKEFIPLICCKLLEATEVKECEVVCVWLYDFYASDNAHARLFAFQFIPCLIWCAMTRSPRCTSGVIAALLSLYKRESAIFDQSSVGGGGGGGKQHEIFPKFSMPNLDLPSIYHQSESNKVQKQNRRKRVERGENVSGKDLIFPSLNQANLSTNLHLIYVALQVFNYYITTIGKTSICLEQLCAVIAKLCSSGIDASQPLSFPENISEHFAWDWKWYTGDNKEKQYQKYIIPSVIMSQFLSTIRYSLKQPKTQNIAKFALAQIHKRGHVDMIPEVILMTTSMLHSAFMDGLTF